MTEPYLKNLEIATPFFEFAEQNRLWLFPVCAGRKKPACQWKSESSSDPAQWRQWITEGHMLGINACASGIVLVDVDIKIGRVDAWNFIQSWFAENLKINAWELRPFCISPSGGWHYAFRCTEGFDPAQHRAANGRLQDVA